MILPKISTSTALTMAETGYVGMRPRPALKAGMRMVVQVLPGQEGSNEPTRSLRGPLLPSQSPATSRMAYRIQKWSISTQLFKRRRWTTWKDRCAHELLHASCLLRAIREISISSCIELYFCENRIPQRVPQCPEMCQDDV